MYGYSEHQVTAFVFLALVGLAGIAALFGWVIPMDDSASRFRWRFIANGITAAAFFWLGADQRFWITIVDFILAAMALGRSSRWWRKSEALRKVSR